MVVDKTSVEFLNWIIEKSQSPGGQYNEFIKRNTSETDKIFTDFNIQNLFHLKLKQPDTNIIFENCTFSEVIIESSVKNITFKNCNVAKLILQSLRVETIAVIGDTKDIKVNSISFTSCTCNQVVISTDVEILEINTTSGRISISGEVRQAKFSSNANIPQVNLTGFIRSCEINGGHFPLCNNFKVGDLLARNVAVGAITGCANNMTFEECDTGNITLDHVFCLNNLTLYAILNKEESKINLIDCHVGGRLLIKDCSCPITFIKENKELQYAQYNSINILAHLGSIRFEVHNLSFYFVVNELSFERVSIPANHEFILNNIYCWNLKFWNFVSDVEGMLMDIKEGLWLPNIETMDQLIEAYRLKLIKDSGIVTKSPDSSEPTLTLIKSMLGKMQLMNVKLGKFKLIFHSTKIIDIHLIGSDLPQTVEAVLIDKNKREQARQQRMAYTQLKKIYEQQGDSVGANSYFAREMNSHLMSLKFIEEPFEVINLTLNRYTSNHGQSIKYAFWSTMIISISCYLLFCVSMGYSIDWLNGSWVTFKTLSAFYPEFLNPVHRLDSFTELTDDGHFKNLTRLIDGVSRIFLAYVLYQFIQAFRKHGKSK